MCFNKLIQKEDKSRLSFRTVLLDLEYLFLFQKLFEMHVFDYIVDRQNPDNKTEQDTKELIKECKNYTTKILQSFLGRCGFCRRPRGLPPSSRWAIC